MTIRVNDGTETSVEIGYVNHGIVIAINRNELLVIPHGAQLNDVVIPGGDGEAFAMAIAELISNYGISKESLAEKMDENDKPFDWL